MKEKDFESKIKSAKEILDKLTDPQITLAKSMELYKDGINELNEAQKLLENAKLEFETLKNKEEKES